jgi:hypothetical protein
MQRTLPIDNQEGSLLNKRKEKMNKYIRIALFTAVGAALGYGYYLLVGCSAGSTCPISSNWDTSTIYGALSGLVIALFAKKSDKKVDDAGENKNRNN